MQENEKIAHLTLKKILWKKQKTSEATIKVEGCLGLTEDWNNLNKALK